MTMTLREWMQIGGQGDPKQELIALIQILRSAAQGEPATPEGNRTAYLTLAGHYGTSDPRELHAKVTAVLARVLDRPVPDALVAMAVSGNDGEDET